MEELNNLFGSAEQLWQYIKVYAAKAGREATRIVLELYYVMKSPDTPAWDKTIIIAALGYQLLPDDKKLISREKYGSIGLLDNGLALGFAYNRVQARVTPEIESQVDAILNQWFGADATPAKPVSKIIHQDTNNANFGNENWKPQPVSIPVNSESPSIVSRPNPHLGEFSDDEDVIID